MDAKEIFDGFVTEFTGADYNLEEEVKAIETSFLPAVLKIVQKDASFFTDAPRIVCGVNLSELWATNESLHESIWKHLFLLCVASFLHGDIKEKIGYVLETVKGLWSAGGHENDEITKILNDEATEDKFKELLEYIQETRIAKMCVEFVEELDLDEFVGDLNFDNPTELVDMIKNPEHPKIKPIIAKLQQRIQGKLQQGHYTQQQLLSEIEGIKAKIQSMFGTIVNEMLGMKRGETPSTVLMGNSPEARRQRMLARLQKKQREKNSQ